MGVGDTIALKIVGRLQSQNIVQTLHYKVTAQTVADTAICDELCSAWSTTHQAAFLALISEDYELVGYKAFCVSGATLIPGQAVVGDNGTVVGESLPASVAKTITLYPEDVAMKHRGRFMIPGGTANHFDNDDGGVVAAQITSMQALGNALVAGCDNGAGDEFQLVIWGDQGGGNEAFDISVAKARRTPANIRSRRIRELLIG